MNRYSAELPQGDKGGNGFKLPYRYRVTSLHSLWDKVLYEERYNIARPFTEETWTEFQVDVDKTLTDHLDGVLAKNSYGSSNPYVYSDTDFDDWSVEAFEVAKGLYDGISENEVVPQSYLDVNIPIAYHQLVLGGYRMFLVFDYIFSNN